MVPLICVYDEKALSLHHENTVITMSKRNVESAAMEKQDTLLEALQGILDERHDDMCMFKLESMCYRLKCAIIDHSLKLPSLSAFRYYVNGITSADQLAVVAEMLHDCWIYSTLEFYDRPIKKTFRFDDTNLGEHGNDLNENKYLNILHEKYKKVYFFQSRAPKDYETYLVELHSIVTELGRKFNLKIDERFVLTPFLDTKLNLRTLREVYDYLVNQGCLEAGKQNDFVSIFNVSVLALPAKLRWLKKAKRTNKTSFFCLLSLMRMLSSDAVEDTQVKTVIASVFSEEDGTPINVEQLKERNVSPEQRLFDNDIQNIISKQVPKSQKGGTLGGSTE